MALGIPSGGSGRGDILPILKFDAKSGDMIAVTREQQGDGTWQRSEEEVSFPLRMVVDFANIETGWMAFVANAPDFHMAKAGTPTPAKPSPEHKFCVRVRLFTKEYGLREFSHTSKTVLRAIDTLHDRFVADRDSHAGKMPVVEMTGTETVKTSTPQGELKFKAPRWSIVGWTNPPAAFSGESAQEAPREEPKPEPKPAPKAVARDDDPF